MRILQAHKFFYLSGGADRVFFDTAGLLEKNGHEIQYFSMKHPVTGQVLEFKTQMPRGFLSV